MQLMQQKRADFCLKRIKETVKKISEAKLKVDELEKALQTEKNPQKKNKLEKELTQERQYLVKKSEYKSYAMYFPVMIHTNGLGQAAAFFKAKGKAHGLLYHLLSDWLTKENQPFANKSNLLAGITQSDMQAYRLAQAEAQALMDWVKKFAKAYMDEEDDHD